MAGAHGRPRGASARPLDALDGDDPGAQPMDVDGVGMVIAGTALWAVALITMLLTRDTLAAHDAQWWLWACVAGVGLGFLGLSYCVRRRDRLRRGE